MRCCSTAARCWPTCPRTRCRHCGRTCRSRTRCARTSTACTGRWRRSGMSARRDRRARLALAPAEGVDPVWADWVQRWHDTSTLPASGRKGRRNQMLRMGRWLAADHPEITGAGPVDPPELCAAWVAAVDRLRIGDYTQNDVHPLRDRIGEPLMPRTKSGLLAGPAPVLPRLPGVGLDPPPVRPRSRIGHPAQHPRSASAPTRA